MVGFVLALNLNLCLNQELLKLRSDDLGFLLFFSEFGWSWSSLWALSVAPASSFVHVKPDSIVRDLVEQVSQSLAPDVLGLVSHEIKENGVVLPNVLNENSSIFLVD